MSEDQGVGASHQIGRNFRCRILARGTLTHVLCGSCGQFEVAPRNSDQWLSYKSDGVRVWKTTTWKTIKNERPTKKIRRNIQILRGASSAERAKKKAGIGKWIQRYNTWRPRQALANKTPALVYETNRKPGIPATEMGKAA